eukprot:COSAG06_NODE_12632_length_1351_cov_1.315495_1_plen_84_part_00
MGKSIQTFCTLCARKLSYVRLVGVAAADTVTLATLRPRTPSKQLLKTSDKHARHPQLPTTNIECFLIVLIFEQDLHLVFARNH